MPDIHSGVFPVIEGVGLVSLLPRQVSTGSKQAEVRVLWEKSRGKEPKAAARCHH